MLRLGVSAVIQFIKKVSRATKATGIIIGNFYYKMTSQPINEVSTGIFENALEFNDVNSNLVTFGDTVYATKDAAFSISFWFNTSKDATSLITLKSNLDIYPFIVALSSHSSYDDLLFGWNQSSAKPIKHAITIDPILNKWIHLVITYNGSDTFIAYLDGVKITTFAGVGNFGLPANENIIGYNSWFSIYYKGKFDEFAIWDKQLSDAEAFSLYSNNLGIDAREVSPDNLQLYYKFNESEFSQVAIDLSANLNHGTLVNFPLSPWTVRDVENNYDFGRALEFTTNQEVLLPSISLNDFTLSVWIYQDTITNDLLLVEDGNVTMYFAPDSGGTKFRIGGTTITGANPNLVNGIWNHIVVTRTASTFRIWANSVELIITGSTSNAFIIDKISGYTSSSFDYIGSVNDLIIKKDFAITEAQVLALYNGGKGVDPTTVITEPNRYYDFNELNNTLTLENLGTDLNADGTLVGYSPTPWIADGLRSLGVAEEVVYPPISLATGTISIWVTTDNEFFYVLNSTSNAASGLWIDVLSTQVAVRRNNGTVYFFNEDYVSLIQSFEKYHLFVVLSTTTVTVYINGIFIATENRSGAFLIENSFESFGSVNRGNIQNLIIKADYEGTAQNALDIYNLGATGDGSTILTSPDRHYKFDETSGNIAADSSLNGADATLLNFPTDSNHFAPAINEYFENALKFDGAGSANIPSWNRDPALGFAISIWFKGNDAFVYNREGVLSYLQFLSDGRVIHSGIVTNNFGSIDNNIWNHFFFCGTSPNNGQMFINGVASEEGEISTISFIWGIANFGSRTGGGVGFYTGILDEIVFKGSGFYGQEEAIALYNNGQGTEPTAILGAFGVNDRYYKFNGVGTQQYALDESGNGKHGTLINFPSNGMWVAHTPSDIFFKRAIKFNGTSEYIRIANSENIDISQSITVACWANLTDWNGISQEIVSRYVTGAQGEFKLGISSGGTLQPALGLSGGIVSLNFDMSAYTGWHHIAFTATQGGNFALYVDGKSKVTAVIAGTFNTSTREINIGKRVSSNSFYVDGQIDEVVIYDIEATAEQINHLYNEGRGRLATKVINNPVLYLQLNEQGGDRVAKDISGNNNDGILVGFDSDPWVDSERVLLTPSFNGVNALSRIENTSPTKPEFTFGNALKFDGVNDYVDCGIINEVRNTPKLTVSVWVKPVSITSSLNSVVGNYSYTPRQSGWLVSLQNDDILFWHATSTSDGGNNLTKFNNCLTAGVWQHIFITYDGTGLVVKCYVNGVDITNKTQTGSIPATLPNNTGSVLIGQFLGLGRWMNGIMDENALWGNVVGTAQNAIDLYNSGNGALASDIIASPTAYWRMNEADGATTLTDETGNYNGTLNNFNFDGTDGFVRHGYYKELSPYTGIAGGFNSSSSTIIDATDVLPEIAASTKGLIFARVYITDATPTALQVIVSVGDTGSNARLVVAINATDGKLRVFCSDGSTLWYLLTNAQALQDQTWHTIAVLQDGVSPVLYVDGVAPAQTFNTSTDTTGWFADSASVVDNFYIGKRHFSSANGNFWDGYISEVLILDGDVTLTQIAKLTYSPEFTKTDLESWGIDFVNVKAWYPLTENGGDTAYDYSDNANHGTWTNPAYETGLSTARQLGLQNVSRYSPFDGINDVVNVSTPFTLSEGTIAFWFMPLQSSYNRVIGGDGSSNLSYINPRIGSSQILVRINSAANQLFFTDPLPMTIGNWYHVAVTFNSTTANCFVNGIACDENPFNIPVESNTFQVFNLGRLWQTTTYGKQILDDIAVWDTILDQDDITDIYNGALASDYSSENLQLYYKDGFINQNGVFKDLSGNGNDGTPSGDMETIILPEKETIAGIPYDVFGFECNSQNIVGEEETFALRGLGYVDYDGHAGPYTDVKQIQFIIKPTSNNHAYILTDEANNRVAYINGNQVVSDFGLSSVYINNVETDIVITNIWQQVTIEFTTPVDIEKLYIGSSAVPDAFEEFGIDKLNIVKE